MTGQQNSRQLVTHNWFACLQSVATNESIRGDIGPSDGPNAYAKGLQYGEQAGARQAGRADALQWVTAFQCPPVLSSAPYRQDCVTLRWPPRMPPVMRAVPRPVTLMWSARSVCWALGSVACGSCVIAAQRLSRRPSALARWRRATRIYTRVHSWISISRVACAAAATYPNICRPFPVCTPTRTPWWTLSRIAAMSRSGNVVPSCSWAPRGHSIGTICAHGRLLRYLLSRSAAQNSWVSHRQQQLILDKC